MATETDRDMDAVFDNLLALNSFAMALARALDCSTARAVAMAMDTDISELSGMPNPPGNAGLQLMLGLRNACAQRSGLPITPVASIRSMPERMLMPPQNGSRPWVQKANGTLHLA